MLIGDKSTFAIECYHDPIPNDIRRVFGRVCIWVNNVSLGSLSEPSCILNVTEGHLQDVLNRFDSLAEPDLSDLNDRETYLFLDRLLYKGDERSDEQVHMDAERYGKFDFMTNGGESFDGSKSFLAISENQVRIVFSDQESGFASGLVLCRDFQSVVDGFLRWVSKERKNAQ